MKAGIPTDDVYWGDFIATERRIGMLGDVRGKRMLEIGCGGAQNSIALSKWDAHTVGIDLSRKQVAYGMRLAKKEGVRVDLVVGNMEQLPFKDESFDMVTTAISLQYAPDLEATMAEANRVLVRNGLFVFSAEHPLMSGKNIVYRGKPAVAVRAYFDRRIARWIDTLSDGSRVRMHSYYRTVQDHMEGLIRNGFVVERYLEPERLEKESLHPLDRERIRDQRWARSFYRMMKEVPVWFIVKARRTSRARKGLARTRKR